MEPYWGDSSAQGTPEVQEAYSRISPGLGFWHPGVVAHLTSVGSAQRPTLRGHLENGSRLDPVSTLNTSKRLLGKAIRYDDSGEYFVLETDDVRLELVRPRRW